MGDTSWFPKPRAKPVPKPPSMTRLLAGTLLPVVAIAGVVVALSTSHSHAPSKTSSKAAAVTTGPQNAVNVAAERRAAFEACLKNMGVGGGGGRGFGGRFGGFGGGSASKLRQAFDICNTLAQEAGSPAPAPTQTGSAPDA